MFLVKQLIFYRITPDHFNNISLDANGDNIQFNAYNMYKLNNSNDQISLNTFNETFHLDTNKLYSYSSGIPPTDKFIWFCLFIVGGRVTVDPSQN